MSFGLEDPTRAALERAAAARTDVKAVARANADNAVAALKASGLVCRGDDTGCLVKLGLEGDFDLILVAGATEIHVVDVTTGRARGPVSLDPGDTGGSLALALAQPAATTATAPIKAATPAPPVTAPANPTVAEPPKFPLALVIGFTGGAVAVGLLVGAAVVDVDLSGQLQRAKDGAVLDTGPFHTLETVEAALVAGSLTAGVATVALVLAE